MTAPPVPDNADLARTWCFSLQKGGTHKTTTVAQAGAEAARLGARVLIIDFDPNYHLTYGCLGYDPAPPDAEPDLTSADLLTNAQPGGAADAVLSAPPIWQPDTSRAWEHGGALTSGGDLAFIPGFPSLDQAASDGANAGERRLRRSLRDVAGRFDLVLIDTGPRADRTVQTALLASGWCLSPVRPEQGSINGLGMHLDLLEGFAAAWEHPLRFAGAVVSGYDQRNSRSHTRHLEALRGFLPTRDRSADELGVTQLWPVNGTAPEEFAGTVGDVWPTVVPSRTAVSRAEDDSRPLSTDLQVLNNSATPWTQQRAAERSRDSVITYAAIALGMLQISQSPAMPRIAQTLRNAPQPGLWPPANQDTDLVARAE